MVSRWSLEVYKVLRRWRLDGLPLTTRPACSVQVRSNEFDNAARAALKTKEELAAVKKSLRTASIAEKPIEYHRV